MAEVSFYHFERKSVDQELPSLLQRGVAQGIRMAVVAQSAERVKDLSQKIWGHDETAFIPHGFEGEPNADSQLIYLCSNDQPANGAAFRYYIGGATPVSLEGLKRANILFDGQDESAVENARGLWRRFKAEGALIKYWKQDDDGRWKDQAAS
jgi:DNA polymerase III subunit chi